jgi:hypothetical protein
MFHISDLKHLLGWSLKLGILFKSDNLLITSFNQVISMNASRYFSKNPMLDKISYPATNNSATGFSSHFGNLSCYCRYVQWSFHQYCLNNASGNVVLCYRHLTQVFLGVFQSRSNLQRFTVHAQTYFCQSQRSCQAFILGFLKNQSLKKVKSMNYLIQLLA